MKHFRLNNLKQTGLKQTQRGFSHMSWRIVTDCLNPCAKYTAGLEPSAVQHA